MATHQEVDKMGEALQKVNEANQLEYMAKKLREEAVAICMKYCPEIRQDEITARLFEEFASIMNNMTVDEFREAIKTGKHITYSVNRRDHK